MSLGRHTCAREKEKERKKDRERKKQKERERNKDRERKREKERHRVTTTPHMAFLAMLLRRKTGEE